jgi:hypothetical protein
MGTEASDRIVSQVVVQVIVDHKDDIRVELNQLNCREW